MSRYYFIASSLRSIWNMIMEDRIKKRRIMEIEKRHDMGSMKYTYTKMHYALKPMYTTSWHFRSNARFEPKNYTLYTNISVTFVMLKDWYTSYCFKECTDDGNGIFQYIQGSIIVHKMKHDPIIKSGRQIWIVSVDKFNLI